jgi:cysteine desulfurase family protein
MFPMYFYWQLHMIYLDHAATSWPKPSDVIRAMKQFMDKSGGNPGRSGHRLSVDAGRIVYNVREAVADFFRVPDPLRVIFTPNATVSINLVLRGFLNPGDTVVTTGLEHNAVMRPLRALEKSGVKVIVAACNPDGAFSLEQWKKALPKKITLAVITHASNVTGEIIPVAEAARLSRRAGALVLVDAAQTAGCVPIDMTAMGVDFLAFTGHKHLLGPQGTGGLVLGARINSGRLKPLICGGTGSQSDSEEQPDFLPDTFESGTLNGPGIAGLGAGIAWLQKRGMVRVQRQLNILTRRLLQGLALIPGIKIYGPAEDRPRAAAVSFTLARKSVSDIGRQLDEHFKIMCRVGLHCAPLAHRSLGTFPHGTVRFAPGVTNTLDEMDIAIRAVEKISRS